jgi:hypothetical protein
MTSFFVVTTTSEYIDLKEKKCLYIIYPSQVKKAAALPMAIFQI